MLHPLPLLQMHVLNKSLFSLCSVCCGNCIAGTTDFWLADMRCFQCNQQPTGHFSQATVPGNAAVLFVLTCTDVSVITGLTEAAAFLCRYGPQTRRTLWLRLTSRPMCAAPSTTQSRCTRSLWEQQTTPCSPMTCARVTRLCTPIKVPSQPSKGPRPP